MFDYVVAGSAGVVWFQIKEGIVVDCVIDIENICLHIFTFIRWLASLLTYLTNQTTVIFIHTKTHTFSQSVSEFFFYYGKEA